MNWSKPGLASLRIRGPFAAVLLLTLLLVWGQASEVEAADDFAGLSAAIRAANGSSRAITLKRDITLSAVLPRITGRLTIDGGGHSISGNDAFRIFDVDGGALTISNVTLTGGNASEGAGGAIRLRNGAWLVIENSTLSGHRAKSGGAIVAYGGTVRISDSRFEKNCALSATFTSKLQGQDKDSHSVDADGCTHIDYERRDITAELHRDVDGGAIRLSNGARADIERSTFSGNKATYGGAISAAARSVRLSVSGSSFIDNRASVNSGAIRVGGSVSINGSSFVNNRAGSGGGGAIVTNSNSLDIANSTFSKNFAISGSGALAVYPNATVAITHATFVDNRTRWNGAGAIDNAGGNVSLRNSIVVSSGDIEDCVGAREHSGNLSTDGTCADRPSDDPRLGELTGSPAHYPLIDRSPAIDYADPAYCLETDQLGTPRPQGGGCDIGAIEARGATAAEPTPAPPLVCTLAFEIVAANRDRAGSGCPAGSGVDTITLDRDIILFEPLPAITSHIIIEGNGHSISGDRKYRIFDVDGGTLTVKNLTMKGGYSATDNGGAIRLQNNGRATVSDSHFINNSAHLGGAVFIAWVGTDRSRLTLNRTRLIGNQAYGGGNGGAIYAGGGTISVSNSSFVGNAISSYGHGGAILMVNSRSRLDVVNSSFINGSRHSRSLLSMQNGATATLTHVTIHGRYADVAALYTREDSLETAGKFNLRNSIIIGVLPEAVCDNLRQNIANLIKDGACSPKLSGDPLLEEATDSSTYLELMPGSPAIGAADTRFCPETDQLGRARSFVGRCDIGAIESIPVPQALPDCQVTTTHGLNFRDGPAGRKLGIVPEKLTAAATARTPGWFQIEHEGETGWISADFVVTEGNCNPS